LRALSISKIFGLNFQVFVAQAIEFCGQSQNFRAMWTSRSSGADDYGVIGDLLVGEDEYTDEETLGRGSTGPVARAVRKSDGKAFARKHISGRDLDTLEPEVVSLRSSDQESHAPPWNTWLCRLCDCKREMSHRMW